MNSGNVGVALLGSYATVLPPLVQRSAFEDQLAALAGRRGMDPVQLDFRYVTPSRAHQGGAHHQRAPGLARD